MSEIEEFVDDLLENLGDKLQEFLEKRDREYQERAKLGVQISEGWNGYNVLIGGHNIRIEHDTSMHRWQFEDEHYSTFFELSEKKGEAVVQFLKELAKVLSSVATAPSEKNIAMVRNEETFSQDIEDPESSDEEIIEEGEA